MSNDDDVHKDQHTMGIIATSRKDVGRVEAEARFLMRALRNTPPFPLCVLHSRGFVLPSFLLVRSTPHNSPVFF